MAHTILFIICTLAAVILRLSLYLVVFASSMCHHAVMVLQGRVERHERDASEPNLCLVG